MNLNQNATPRQIMTLAGILMVRHNIDLLKALSSLQTAAAKMGAELLIETIGEMKMELFLNR